MSNLSKQTTATHQGHQGDNRLTHSCRSRWKKHRTKYTYDTAGILTERTAGSRATTITSRDGEGRPLSIATTVNSSSELTESLVWAPEGLITTDTLARADFTDSRSYSYAPLSRRLTNEVLNINGSTRWTNNMTYDNGVAAELGTLTQLGPTNNWNGVEDVFSRVNTETNTAISYPAYGHINGQSTLFGWLDNNPISITSDGTNAMQWRASMELTPGAHQLKVAALHPSGFYTAWATNSFTNKLAYQATADTFDSAGNITQRIWKNPNGTTNLIQTLSWDARGRLHGVTNRDTSNSGYNWSAVYDPLNRRIQTTTVLVSNSIPYSVPPTVINSYYDPQVEFLELGVQYGFSQEWKLYGPDSNGKYGGLNGTGGFDGVSPGLDLFYPTIADERGDILAQVTNGVVAWNAARPTGYGAVPSYRPVALGNGADIVQSSAWRGRWVDITGYYEIGLRPYNPISGSWLTYDSISDERNPNCYTFAGGDPINYFDADGRIGKSLYDNATSPDFGYKGGLTSFAFNEIGLQLNNYANSSDNSVLGPIAASLGTWNTELGAMSAPSTYVNGLVGFGNNVDTIYNDSGLLAASSYAISGWNVGKVYSGIEDINLVTGEPIGDFFDRATDVSSGVASTAGIGALGLGGFDLLVDSDTTPGAADAEAQTGPTAATADVIAQRQALAQQFYQAAGFTDDQIASHMQGIDFSQPVQPTTLPAGTQVVQYQVPGDPVGNYFAPVGTSADSLGISSVGRVGNTYVTTSDTSVLQSTAADTSQNLNVPPSVRGSGGGTQYFAPQNSTFSPQ